MSNFVVLTHYPYATVLDHPDLRALVLKAVAWGPPGETLSTVAAKLLHGELLAYAAAISDHSRNPTDAETPLLPKLDGVRDAVLLQPVLVDGIAEEQHALLPFPGNLLVAHGISLLEFDPLGVVVNVAYLAAGPQVLGPFLDELAGLAQRYGFHALECYSRRPGMKTLLGRHGWVDGRMQGASVEAPDGFRRFALPVLPRVSVETPALRWQGREATRPLRRD